MSELVAPKAAAGQVISGREYVDPIPVGRGDVASAPSDMACTTGKDTGYYSRLNVRASGALYDIRLPIRSKSSGKVRVFLSTTGEKWSISDSIMVLQSFGGGACPRGALPRPPGRVGLEGGETAWGEGAEAGS